MDTTYFGRQYGIIVLYDSISKQALFVEEVRYESNALYLEGIRCLQEKCTSIQSITCNERRGLEKLFPGIPTQLCQFHQMQIINRYLTRNPKSLAAHELKALALTLKNSTQTGFEAALQAWHEQHEAFLDERTTNPLTHQSRYPHFRLRSACHSLKRNLPHLFTFERYPDLGIHNTTNLLEGRFADLKAKLRCHQGMKKENKVRFIKDYFSKKMPARASILSLRRRELKNSLKVVPYHQKSP
ncbi:MAG: hypothetical protein Q4A06_07025 [Cardiobacteriaceae bacterium]|nr:hypothetical protein [Cardiobacteriaceae bacterium]